MDPLVAELADLADAELQWSLIPEQRDAALAQCFHVVFDRLGEGRQRLAECGASGSRRDIIDRAYRQARAAMDEIKERQFAPPLEIRGFFQNSCPQREAFCK